MIQNKSTLKSNELLSYYLENRICNLNKIEQSILKFTSWAFFINFIQDVLWKQQRRQRRTWQCIIILLGGNVNSAKQKMIWNVRKRVKSRDCNFNFDNFNSFWEVHGISFIIFEFINYSLLIKFLTFFGRCA